MKHKKRSKITPQKLNVSKVVMTYKNNDLQFTARFLSWAHEPAKCIQTIKRIKLRSMK